MAAVSAASSLFRQPLNQHTSNPNTSLSFKPLLPRHFHKHPHSSYRLATNGSFSCMEQGKLRGADELFDEMPQRNAVLWSSIIAMNAKSGYFLEAFRAFEELMRAGMGPYEFALGGLLKASAGLRDVWIGKQLHGLCIRAGFVSEANMRISLINMYSSFGLIDDARMVFDEVSTSCMGDIPMWDSLVAAYVFHGHWNDCFQLFWDMLSMGLASPPAPTYASMINACASVGALEYGRIIHGMIIKNGMLGITTMGNSLITFYAKCGNLDDANRVFEAISQKNIVSWNAIVAGHEQNDNNKEAIDLFRRLLALESCLKPNRITFLSALSAVSSVSALNHGKEIHAQIIKYGLENNTRTANSLITMYSKCGELQKSRLVFERLPCKDIISWNSMLVAFAQNEKLENCFEVFTRMSLSGIEPDDHSLTIVLSAVSSHPSISKRSTLGREIHGHLLKQAGLAAVAISTHNSVLTMYAKCNRLADAEKIFEGMGKRDLYSWNAMMDGYSINGHYGDAILLFIAMLEQSLQSDHLSISILLTACSRLASMQLGKQFHAFIIKQRYCHHDLQSSLLSINNALISMYSKCGNISDASSVFLKMARRDVFSWTAIITGFAHHGMAHESLQLFKKMRTDGIKPNSVTFLGVLTACAHAGLVNEGIHCFNSMSKDCINPNIEHYACMIDLFARLGQFEIAQSWVETGISHLKLTEGTCSSLWKVLLGACHAHKQLELGVHAAMKILESEPEDETTHVLLSNLYSAFGMWSDAVRVRKSLKDRGLKKQEVGSSWIEIRNRRHVFVAGDIAHPHRMEIYEKLEALNGKCRSRGYIPMTEYVLHDVDDLQKEAIISSHSEKLAVSFGLLQSGTGKGVIRVIKNLRVCGDCHNWMKFISLVEERDIVLRDSRHFHLFKGGTCSCGDYW